MIAPLGPHGDYGVLKRSSVRGAAATFVGQGVRFVLQFGSQVLLARLLLPTDFGLVAMLAPLLSLVAVFTDLGLAQATVQRPDISQAELSALFWINTAISLACALLTAALSPLVALFYGEPRLIPVVICLGLLLVPGGVAAQHVALLNRRMQFTALAVMDVASTLLSVAAGLAAAWLGLGYWSLVVMQAVNAVVILGVAWGASRWVPSAPTRQVRGVLGLLRFGGHVTAYNVVNTVGASLDNLLVGKGGGPVALGLYDRAFKLVAAPIWTISLPLARVAVSLLSRLDSAADRYRTAFLSMLQALLLVTVPAVAFTAAMAGTLVPVLLGPGWDAAEPMVMWLAVATGFAPLSIAAYWLFISQGRAEEQTRYALWRTLLRMGAMGVGLPWGAVGIAAALAVSAPLVQGLSLWGAVRRGPVRPGDAVRACAPLLVAGLAAWAGVRSADGAMQAAGWTALPRLGAGVALAYAVCGAALLCMPGGNGLLRSLWSLRLTFRRAAA